MAQVAVQRCDVFEPVALDRAAEQVERVLLYLQTGHGEVLAPAKQRSDGQNAASAAEVEDLGTPAYLREGGEQDAVLTELEKSVVL